MIHLKVCTLKKCLVPPKIQPLGVHVPSALGGQGGCDRRIEKFLGKFTKKKISGGGGVGWGGGGGGGQGGCERRIEVFLQIQKKKKNWGRGGGGGGGGVRVDENEELKFL